jgi:hypothetical protein
MKKALFAALFLGLFHISLDGTAQVNKGIKVVLKNGITIKGAILESIDDSFVKIRIQNNEEPITIRLDRIDRIKFKDYETLDEETKEKIPLGPHLETKSFFHEFKPGILLGEEEISWSIQTINGYQFHKYVGTGLGVGINKYANHITLPVYVSIKGYLMDSHISPFYFGDIGYGFAWDAGENDNYYRVNDVQGGLYWQVGVGYQLHFQSNALVFSLGYVNQQTSTDYTYDYWYEGGIEVSEKRTFRRVNFSIGIMF